MTVKNMKKSLCMEIFLGISIFVSLLEATTIKPKFINKVHFQVYDGIPPHQQKALTARYVVHKSDWGVIGTISTHFGRQGLPFTNVMSFCDGPLDNSTGIPYAYVVDLDVSMQDVKKNDNVSVTLTEMETEYCLSKHYDAEDPRCARVTLFGKLLPVKDEREKHFALKAIFSRHPYLKIGEKFHAFYPVKLQIDSVWMMDYFGGGSLVPLKEYFDADPVNLQQAN